MQSRGEGREGEGSLGMRYGWEYGGRGSIRREMGEYGGRGMVRRDKGEYGGRGREGVGRGMVGEGA